MKTITLGPYAKMMGYFEDDQEFDSAAENLLTVYERLCQNTLLRMRSALSDDTSRKEAICFYSGVQALQAVLSMHEISDPDKKPDLQGFYDYVREVAKLNFSSTNK